MYGLISAGVKSSVRICPVFSFIGNVMNILTRGSLRFLVPPKSLWKTSGTFAGFAVVSKFEIPHPPKKPQTPYFKFMNYRRPNLHQKHPDWSVTDILRYIANEWKALTPEEKKPYQVIYVQEIAEYKNAEEKWWSDLTSEQKETFWKNKNDCKNYKVLKRLKKKLRLLGKPQKPHPAFLLYASQQAKANESSHKSFEYFLQSWKALSAADRQSYIDVAKHNLGQYNNELLAWEFRMMKEGHGHLLRQLTMRQRNFLHKKSKS